jgi:amino acid transporter
VRSASIVRVANDKADRNIPRAVAVAAVAVGVAAVALAVIVTGAAKPQLLLDPGDWCDAATVHARQARSTDRRHAGVQSNADAFAIKRGTDMRLGSGIFLLVVGAILAFAVQDRWSAVDLTMIGWIAMAAGVLTIILSLVINQQRQNTSHREISEQYINRTPPPPPVV